MNRVGETFIGDYMESLSDLSSALDLSSFFETAFRDSSLAYYCFFFNR